MAKIKEMLKNELKVSCDFQQANFGLMVGDDYPDLVRELLHSDTCRTLLQMGVMRSGEGIADLAKGFLAAGGKSGDVVDRDLIERVMLQHHWCVDPFVEFLYWGIRIGRKLEREESDALKKMEQDIGPSE